MIGRTPNTARHVFMASTFLLFLACSRVDDQEFCQLLDKAGITDDIHLFNEKLREWEDYYNYHRPHGALDGQTQYERLVAKTRAGVSPTS